MILLQKSKTADVTGIPDHWLVSEKWDGKRAMWDGGISQGQTWCPWRNRGKRSGLLPCTGLWSGNGLPIQAPDWWLDALPRYPLDGELWAGRGRFQFVMSTCRRDVPTEAWREIRYCLFDAPTHDELFVDRLINIPTCKMLIKKSECNQFVAEMGVPWIGGTRRFEENLEIIDALPPSQVYLITGYVPWDPEFLRKVQENNGEGVIVRDPYAIWRPDRVSFSLKIKPDLDDEGIIVGWTLGKGKYTGMMGSLTLRWRDKHISISGFTDQERELEHFKIGEMITFKYRELTNAGLPKEARYLRRRN